MSMTISDPDNEVDPFATPPPPEPKPQPAPAPAPPPPPATTKPATAAAARDDRPSYAGVFVPGGLIAATIVDAWTIHLYGLPVAAAATGGVVAVTAAGVVAWRRGGPKAARARQARAQNRGAAAKAPGGRSSSGAPAGGAAKGRGGPSSGAPGGRPGASGGRSQASGSRAGGAGRAQSSRSGGTGRGTSAGGTSAGRAGKARNGGGFGTVGAVGRLAAAGANRLNAGAAASRAETRRKDAAQRRADAKKQAKAKRKSKSEATASPQPGLAVRAAKAAGRSVVRAHRAAKAVSKDDPGPVWWPHIAHATAAMLAPLAKFARWFRAAAAYHHWSLFVGHEPTTPPARKPRPAPPRPQPGAPIAPPAHTPETIRMSTQIDELIEAINTTIGSYEPQSPIELQHYLTALPEVFTALAAAAAKLGERLAEEKGVHHLVAECVAEAGAAATAATGWAQNAAAVLAGHHEADLIRHAAPRMGEQDFWNVG